jgi:hypothetical protein
MTLAAILAAVTEVAKLGTGGLDFWKQLHTTAATEIDKVEAHDAQLKTAPEPGQKET